MTRRFLEVLLKMHRDNGLTVIAGNGEGLGGAAVLESWDNPEGGVGVAVDASWGGDSIGAWLTHLHYRDFAILDRQETKEESMLGGFDPFLTNGIEAESKPMEPEPPREVVALPLLLSEDASAPKSFTAISPGFALLLTFSTTLWKASHSCTATEAMTHAAPRRNKRNAIPSHTGPSHAAPRPAQAVRARAARESAAHRAGLRTAARPPPPRAPSWGGRALRWTRAQPRGAGR